MINNIYNFEIMSFMDSFSEHNRVKIYLDDEKYILSKILCVIVLHGDALWPKECAGHVPASHDVNFLRLLAKDC